MVRRPIESSKTFSSNSRDVVSVGVIPICRRVALVCSVVLAAAVAQFAEQVDAGEPEVDERHAAARATITSADLRKHVEFLASDTLEGRRGGTDGARAAAAYLASQFRSFGLKPAAEGFRQEFGDLGMQNIVAVWGDAKSGLAPIVVSAHYDHVGTGGKGTKKENDGLIHNGADDNASGTALVLEVAEACSSLPAPARPVVFALWDGEEQGLIGSGEYAKAHEEAGTLPSLAIVCDMIGRSSCDRVFVFGVDTVTGLEAVVENAINDVAESNRLRPTYIRKHLPRSDHWPFYKRDVPYLFFHTGIHESYHRPTDDADTLNYDTAETISRLTFDILLTMTDTDFDLTLNPASKELPKTNLPPKSQCEPEPDSKPDSEDAEPKSKASGS